MYFSYVQKWKGKFCDIGCLAQDKQTLNMCKSKGRKGAYKMYTQKGKKYIYSVGQANEFIQRGYRCIETGFNAKQQKFFWAFDYEEVQEYYRTSNRYK